MSTRKEQITEVERKLTEVERQVKEIEEAKKDILENFDFAKSLQSDLDGLEVEFFAEIGKISTAWTVFERILDANIWVLIKGADTKHLACLTAQIPNTARRFDALLSLVRLRGGSEDIVGAINKFAAKSLKLGLKRNRTVHDTWGVHSKTGTPTRHEISAQKRLVYEERHVEIKELKSLLAEIINHIRAYHQEIFNRIAEEIILKPPSLPDKPQ